MNDEKLKSQLGSNIAQYRKSSGMTQAKLAEQLNYSDKAVSKWERGESMPDVPTLARLAQLFGVSVDTLLRDPEALPEDIGSVERAMGKAVESTLLSMVREIVFGVGFALLLPRFFGVLGSSLLRCPHRHRRCCR